MYRLPYPSRDQYGGGVSRLHVVGQRDGWRAYVSEGAAQSIGRRALQNVGGESGECRRARIVEGSFVPGKNRQPGIQSAAQANAIRRFSRSRLGISRGVQA